MNENNEIVWSVSAAWASKHIDCTLNGIIKGCGGACCKNSKYFPVLNPKGACFYLGENGCKLTPQEKPIKCLLFPMVIREGKLILFGRALLHFCKPNYKKNEISILENQKNNFIELFGEEAYARCYDDIIVKGVNSWVKPSPILLQQLEREIYHETNNIIPPPRTTPL